jgi:xanthine phosphoribosyltransferase
MDFKKDLNSLLGELRSSQVEAIIGIARGGLCMAHCMAEGLNIREVQTIRTELYDKSCKRDEITIFDNCAFSGVKKVLVVDDISDSGETLKRVMEYLEEKYPDIEFISATLFYKKTSIYKPHFWVNEANAWIEFFWEEDFKGKELTS